MTYEPLPRPVTTPDMRERARALLGAAQRKQNLYAQALVQAELHPTENTPPGGQATNPAAWAPSPAATPDGSLEQLVQHVTHASDQDLLGTHQRLAQARAQAQQMAAADTELHTFMAAAYGAPATAGTGSATAQNPTGHSNVVDVQAREVPTPTGEGGSQPVQAKPSEPG